MSVVLGFSGCAGEDIADAERFCELTHRIDEISLAANDQRLSPEAAAETDEAVRAIAELIPESLEDTFFLRYWPAGGIQRSDLKDTSGVAAQAAYARWRDVREHNCADTDHPRLR